MSEAPHLDDPLTNGLPPASETVGVPGHDTATSMARGARIVRLRAMGATYAQIAQAEGYTDPGTARHALVRTLRAHQADAVADLRAVEDERLDIGLAAIVPLLSHTDPHVRLKAHAELVRNSKRRSDMWGLDAPKQVLLSAGVQADLDRVLGELENVVLGEVVPDEPELLEG